MSAPVTLAFVGHATAEMADAASAYEDDVLPLLAGHGGELLFRGRRQPAEDPALPLEVHVIRFPDRAAYDAYLADPARQQLLDRHGEVFTAKTVVEVDALTNPA